MRYRIRLHGTWHITPAPTNGDGKYKLESPLIFEAGDYIPVVMKNPYPFGAGPDAVYYLLEKDGRLGGFTLAFWRHWNHDAHGAKRVEILVEEG
mgnify:CR=1 FL=1